MMMMMMMMGMTMRDGMPRGERTTGWGWGREETPFGEDECVDENSQIKVTLRMGGERLKVGKMTKESFSPPRESD
jgi:hypothetical protein